MGKKFLLSLLISLFTLSQSYAGFFLFSPQKKETKKESKTQKESPKETFEKFLKRYGARRVLPPRENTSWERIKIIGYFNDKCMISYEGERYILPKKACVEIELKRIRLLKEGLK